jgi:hypothetical protein
VPEAALPAHDYRLREAIVAHVLKDRIALREPD